MRELLYRQRKGLSTAKNRITGQEHDWLGEAYVTVRLDVPGLQGCKVILPGPIFVFLRKATRLRSQKRLMIVIAMSSSPPGLSRISIRTPFRALKSCAILSRAAVNLRFLTPSSSRMRM